MMGPIHHEASRRDGRRDPPHRAHRARGARGTVHDRGVERRGARGIDNRAPSGVEASAPLHRSHGLLDRVERAATGREYGPARAQGGDERALAGSVRLPLRRRRTGTAMNRENRTPLSHGASEP
jgi:hypothetical protein